MLLLFGRTNNAPMVDWSDAPGVYPPAGVAAVDGDRSVPWAPTMLPAGLIVKFPYQRVQKAQLLFPEGKVPSVFDISTRVSARAPWTVRHVASGVTSASLTSFTAPASRYWVSPALDVDAVELRVRVTVAESGSVEVSALGVEFGEVSAL